MQGLNARILLPRPLSEHQRIRVLHWLSLICESIEEDQAVQEGWDCWISNGYPLRIRYKGPARRLFLSLYEEDSDIEPPAAPEIRQTFGWSPAYAINIGAYDASPIDHNLLGGMALVLAEQLNGLVDYRGYLIAGRHSEAQVERDKHLARLKGTLCTINSYYQYHVSDPIFLRSWLQHPQFTMV